MNLQRDPCSNCPERWESFTFLSHAHAVLACLADWLTDSGVVSALEALEGYGDDIDAVIAEVTADPDVYWPRDTTVEHVRSVLEDILRDYRQAS